jgi:replicative DNA helicase
MRSTEKTNRRHEEVGLISNGLKAIANNLEIPVIACTQANRDAANEPLQLHHLRESGSLEMDADIVLLLHEDGNDHVKVKVAKNRNGRAGSVVTFRFNKAYGIFTHVPTVDF